MAALVKCEEERGEAIKAEILQVQEEEDGREEAAGRELHDLEDGDVFLRDETGGGGRYAPPDAAFDVVEGEVEVHDGVDGGVVDGAGPSGHGPAEEGQEAACWDDGVVVDVQEVWAFLKGWWGGGVDGTLRRMIKTVSRYSKNLDR